jgi:hypothetical protein
MYFNGSVPVVLPDHRLPLDPKSIPTNVRRVIRMGKKQIADEPGRSDRVFLIPA